MMVVAIIYIPITYIIKPYSGPPHPCMAAQTNNIINKHPWHFMYLARAFMSIRECWITDRRKEAQEEVVADLHSCLEQLTFRSTEIEQKIERCKQSALYHMQLSRKETVSSSIAREQARARMFMQDRKRMQGEHDKALRSMHMLQQQIDSIVSSHVDMVIVDAMRGFNATAARMALPQRTVEIEKLSESLADRHSEASNLQEVLGTVTFGTPADTEDDALLMRELEDMIFTPLCDVQDSDNHFLLSLPSPPSKLPCSPLSEIPSTPLSEIPSTALSKIPSMSEIIPLPEMQDLSKSHPIWIQELSSRSLLPEK